MTYDEAIAYLDSFVNFEQRHDPQAMQEVKLERMRRLCRRLGDPQRRFRCVLVTGTNGKGSICAMLYAMLKASSLRVGLYTSPHLEHVRERIRVWDRGGAATNDGHGGDWITEAEFADLAGSLRPVLEELREESPDRLPTYFEILTAMALLQFSRRRVEVAVLEVGLGGRLDATNVVDQAVSVIAPIALDHTDVLGDDVASIAREKAGIIKPNQVVMTAQQPEEVMEVLRNAAAAQGVPLVVCGRELTAHLERHDLEGLQATVTGLRGVYASVAMPFVGRHQAQNAALAVGALEALSCTGMPYSLVEQGLRRVEWPGRIEIVHDAPLVFMDGAHNRHAAAALRSTLVELCLGRAIHLLIGISSDKSVEEIGQELGDLVVSVTCTKSRHPRALDPAELARRFFPFCRDVHVMADPIDAYTYVLNTVAPTDVIVVTGSFFLVGELRAAIRCAHVRSRQDPQLHTVIA